MTCKLVIVNQPKSYCKTIEKDLQIIALVFQRNCEKEKSIESFIFWNLVQIDTLLLNGCNTGERVEVDEGDRDAGQEKNEQG